MVDQLAKRHDNEKLNQKVAKNNLTPQYDISSFSVSKTISRHTVQAMRGELFTKRNSYTICRPTHTTELTCFQSCVLRFFGELIIRNWRGRSIHLGITKFLNLSSATCSKALDSSSCRMTNVLLPRIASITLHTTSLIVCIPSMKVDSTLSWYGRRIIG